MYDLVVDVAKQVYYYQNSIYGILDSINTDYNKLDLDIQKLTENLRDKEGVQFLDQVLTKMG